MANVFESVWRKIEKWNENRRPIYRKKRCTLVGAMESLFASMLPWQSNLCAGSDGGSMMEIKAKNGGLRLEQNRALTTGRAWARAPSQAIDASQKTGRRKSGGLQNPLIRNQTE